MSGRGRLVTFAVPALFGALIAVPITASGAQATPAAPARATAGGPPPVVIGVDNAPPPGKNWEYTHYFPETNVNVPQGSLVLFQWNQGSPNGLHTVTFVPNGSTDAQVRSNFPILTADTDNGETDTVIPAGTNNPTNPACGSSPAAPPCVFTGTSVVSSGIIPAFTGAAFPVQVAPNTPTGTYHYICLVHPGMQGSINVVPAGQPATAPAALAGQAAAEYNQLTAGAFAAESAASVPTSTPNANGTRTWKVLVGLTVDDVELLEYLPQVVPIRKGDSVDFDGTGTTQEIHTVTTPASQGAGFGFFGPNECEVAAGPDTPAKQVNNGPPQLGCADPNGLEQVVNLANQGAPSLIPSGSTQASAFVTGNADAQALGGGASHTYSFPNNGTFVFVCTIHAGMFGAVTTPGYRVAQSTGAVSNFGASDGFGSKTSGLPSPVVASPHTLDDQGYWLVTRDGHTYNFGDAGPVGNISGPYNGSPIVGAVSTEGGPGLWLVASDGRVYPLGGAAFMGDLGGVKLAAPIVGITTDGGGSGYDLVGADGGVFNFGSPGGVQAGRFYGSLGGKHLNAPIVGIDDLPGGGGYYLVGSDGGVFAFGATFAGSLGAVHLVAPIVGITAVATALTPPGYRLVSADGGVFNFGTAQFLGSASPVHPPDTTVAIN